MRIHLSEHFTYGKLLRFVFPSIVMMIFTSIYSVVDGLFVSNFVGKTSFAAVNLMAPVLTILNSVGFMIGAGGTAIVGKTLGEQDEEQANRYFSTLIYTIAMIGVVFGGLGFLFLRPLSETLGATGALLDNCILYGRVCMVGLPFYMMQATFQSFFVTAEKPKLGLAVTVTAGITNIILDALFVAVFQWGLFGAAFATAIGQGVGALIPLIYFALPNDSLLQLTTKTKLYPRVLWKACTNGSSEMVSNLAGSLVSLIYNHQLMRLIGEDGIAALGVAEYVSFIFAAIYYGYSMGAAPIVSYQYGAANHSELKNMFRKSMRLTGICGIAMFLLTRFFALPLAKIFVSYDAELLALTAHAIQIFAWSFLFSGINTFGSAFFTALNDGFVSAVLSFLRAFLFQAGSILAMSALLGVDGIWWALTVAELLSLIVTVYFLIAKRKKYQYV